MIVRAGDILGGQHGDHAGQRARLAHIQARDHAAGNHGAFDARVQHALKLDIIGVNSAAGHLGHRIGARGHPADCLARVRRGRHLGRFHRLAGAQRFARRLDRADDGRVTGATAQRILERVLDVVFARVGVVLQQRVGGHQLPGDAEAALHRAVLDESILQRVQPAGGVLLSQPFHRGDVLAVRLDGRVVARKHRLSVDHHRAGAAFVFVAAHLHAGQAQALAQQFGQHFAFHRLHRYGLAVDNKLDHFHAHHSTSMLPARSQAFSSTSKSSTPTRCVRYSAVARRGLVRNFIVSRISWTASAVVSSE